MALNLKDLVAQHAFISVEEPHVKREISWLNSEGDEFTAEVWVRQASYHTVNNSWKAAADNQDHMAARISNMICDADGAPIFTVGDITGEADPTRGAMCGGLYMALTTVISEAQTAKRKPPTTSGSN